MIAISVPRSLITVIFVAFVTACAPVGPNYIPPETEAPRQWSTPLKGGLMEQVSNYTALSTWWKTLDDPVLTNLIQKAISGSLDLKNARSRVREARARRGISAAGIFPVVDATVAATKNRLSEERYGGDNYSLYSAGFDASWEVDVFGGIRRSIEAATADLEAKNEAMRDVMVSLLSEVALNYLDVRTFQLGIEVAIQNLKAQERSYRLALSRYEAGLTNVLDAQRSLLSFQEQLARSKGNVTSNLVRLYKALGGGWTSFLDEPDRKIPGDGPPKF